MLLAFVQDIEASCPEPFIPLLTDIALVRALIVHLVIRYGPERGLVEARDAFNTTFDQMKPILQNMQEEKGHPPQCNGSGVHFFRFYWSHVSVLL